jgi:glucose-6-phosphate 1-dehydrogenase
MTHQELRQQIQPYLDKEAHAAVIEAFLARCYYKKGKSYGDEIAWKELTDLVEEHEAGFPEKPKHNRLFYMATPPNVFAETGTAIKKVAMQQEGDGWSRLVIEKPFGRDLESCQELLQTLAKHFDEHHLYRIDHYLGKEVVQNILIWRFGNTLFEWFWNRNAIQSVHIVFKEDFGTEGRGGYFDSFGIIRDILQNHLLQVLVLLAMEPPTLADGAHAGEYIRDAKHNLLMSMSEIKLEDCLLGQYKGYADDETITNKETSSPTYAAIRCFVNTRRWAGVPFVLEAGKALDERLCEVRLQFRDPPAATTLFPNRFLPRNELVMRLQPNPAIYMKTNIKSPGFAFSPMPVAMGMDYETLPSEDDSPDAYARLILDVLRGHQGSFVRSDELERSWEIFTPLLHRIEQNDIRPLMYISGSTGPEERADFMDRMGIEPSAMQYLQSAL